MISTFNQISHKVYFNEAIGDAGVANGGQRIEVGLGGTHTKPAESAANVFPVQPKKDKTAQQEEARNNKRKEQARKEFAAAARELATNGAGRNPGEKLNDWLARVPPQLTEQAVHLRRAMLESVRVEGIPLHMRDNGPNQPRSVSIDELELAYNRYLGREQARETVFSYDKYQAEHPVFQTKGNIQFAPSTPQEVKESTGYIKSIETKASTTHNVTAFIGLDKGEDSIAIATDPQGRVNIAVADGVSNTVVPAVTSREAVSTAVDELGNGETPEQVFANVHDHLQAVDIPTYARAYRKHLFALHQQDTTKGLYRSVTKIDEELRRGDYAATTLGIMQYNPTTGECIGRLKGDTSLVVIRKDGRFEAIENPDMSQQFMYEADSLDSSYHPDSRSEAAINLQLENGDIAILFSDGLKLTKDQQIKDAVIAAAKYSNTTGARGDSIVTNVIRSQVTEDIEKKAIPDDISIVVLQHRGQAKAT